MHNILGIFFWDTHREKEKNMETITFSIWVVSSCYWAYAPLLRTSGMHKTGSPVVWLYGSLSWERDYMFECLLAWVEGLYFLLYTRQRCYKWTHYGKYRSGRDLHTLELRRLYTNETIFRQLQRLAAGLQYWFPYVFFWWFQETKFRPFPPLFIKTF